MKHAFRNTFYVLLLFTTILVACRKDESIQHPHPIPGKTNKFSFVLNDLPGTAPSSPNSLLALVSIRKINGEEVVGNKMVQLTFNGKYATEKMELPDGAYQVTRFLILDEAKSIRFAAPLAGSAKASQVQKPLMLPFALPMPSSADLPIEVAKVEATDQPESFGYPAGTFNSIPGDSRDSVKIKVKAVFQVGNIVYDSIPAALTLNTWDSAGQMTTRSVDLAAGSNTISLARSGAKYQMVLSKWGVTDQITLMKNQVDAGTTYSLGGTKAAKKITLVEDYLLVEGAYVPDAKTMYTYSSNGLLHTIDHYQKKPQHSGLIKTITDTYVYRGNRVRRINRTDENNLNFGFTEFSYNAEGKVVNMHKKNYDQETFGVVEYSYPAGHAAVTIHYLYDNGKGMEYQMKIKGGNKVEDFARSSTGISESGNYAYDFNINPYAHMNMPDVFLSNLSRNNLTGQQKSYSGSIPNGVPYKYEYRYDQEGYPVELVRSFRSHLSGEELFKIKTVYTY